MTLKYAKRDFRKDFTSIKQKLPPGWKLYKSYRDDKGDHPIDYKDIECAFTSTFLNLPPNSKILNVGSYSQYIIGLLANYNITTLDVRNRIPFISNEEIITQDVKETSLPDNSFDAIISLSSIEHFGLGRYGDTIDLDADTKAFNQFKRLLKPGGLLIFTTTIKKDCPEILFNANKTYIIENIHMFCEGLEKVEEMFISKSKLEFCGYEEITSKPQTWDIYCGCWRNVK